MDTVEALTSPMLDEHWLKKVVVGGLLLFIPIVSLTVYGYILRTTRMAALGEDKLPEWNGWWGLFVGGLKLLVLTLLYLVIPALLLLAMLLAVLFATDCTSSEGYVGEGYLWLVVPLVVYILLALVASFFLSMAIVRLAVSKSLRESLKVGGVCMRIKVVFNDFLKGFVLALLTAVALYVLPNLFAIGNVSIELAVVLSLVSVFLLFYFSLAFAILFGRLYALAEATQ